MSVPEHPTAEHRRLSDSTARRADWKNWGPYLAERAWGTVREDYSASGDAWNHFPHDHARSRVYRWNEDGLAGYCNRFQNLCLSLALWNEQRSFSQGTPLWPGQRGRQPWRRRQGVLLLSRWRAEPRVHADALQVPAGRISLSTPLRGKPAPDRADPEFELIDALGGAFAAGRYFDVFVDYAKASEDDILCRITAYNRGPEPAPLHILPQLWFRNTWSWGHHPARPVLEAVEPSVVRSCTIGIWASAGGISTSIRTRRLFFSPRTRPISSGSLACPMPGRSSRTRFTRRSSAAGTARLILPGGARKRRPITTPWSSRADVSLSEPASADAALDQPFGDFDAIFERRVAETDEFYRAIQPAGLDQDERRVQRQAFAGLLWTKQFYHYSVELWLDGDPAGPEPPKDRRRGRNAEWPHVYNLDVLSVPDKWEYPWFAAWDTAFHCIVLARLDPEWAKRQVILLLREWYMHPSGQLPAYEWDFSDANPPVHAHAARRVYEITRELTGESDTQFLEEVFHKLLLNFTWWVNRKDPEGRNAFQGGFLGLDNIGVFDRSRPNLGEGRRLEQADGTAWMGMFCLDMLAIALELSQTRPAYEAIATKFFEHFVAISHAINGFGGEIGMWDQVDGFYYDVLRVKGDRPSISRSARSWA